MGNLWVSGRGRGTCGPGEGCKSRRWRSRRGAGPEGQTHPGQVPGAGPPLPLRWGGALPAKINKINTFKLNTMTGNYLKSQDFLGCIQTVIFKDLLNLCFLQKVHNY